MTAQEKIGEELEYAILNLELDLNTWKIKMNSETNEEYKKKIESQVLQLGESLAMLKIKKGLFDEIRGSAKN